MSVNPPTTFLLDLKHHFTPWGMPTLPEVLCALRAKFVVESGLTCVPGRNRDLGTYRIVLPNATGGDLTIPLKVMGKEQHFTLTPVATQTSYAGPTNRQLSEGVLYTLYDCTLGPWADIPNATFDDAVRKLGTLTKQTEHQRFRGSSIFNGNRYFCLQANGTMPDSITITDPANPDLTHKVRLGYKGKSYYCPRCQSRHVGACPAKAAFYDEKRLRESRTIKTTVFTDSTLRQADVTGLSANVVCMSGGRIGNVSHMLQDDPAFKEHTHAVVIAGINDINRDTESTEAFKQTMEKGVEMIHHHCHGRDVSLTMVAPLLPSDAAVIRVEKARAYDDMLTALCHKADFPFTYLRTNDLDIDMDGYHPSPDGTKALLKAIHGAVNIIENEQFIVTDRLYQGVEAVFRYGCLSCHEYLGLDQRFLCPSCVISGQPQHHPHAAPSQPSDVEMEQARNKRLLDTAANETPSKKTTPNRPDGDAQ